MCFSCIFTSWCLAVSICRCFLFFLVCQCFASSLSFYDSLVITSLSSLRFHYEPVPFRWTHVKPKNVPWVTDWIQTRCCPLGFRVNGKLVALKVIRLQEEEGTPFTAIREGELEEWTTWQSHLFSAKKPFLTFLSLSCRGVKLMLVQSHSAQSDLQWPEQSNKSTITFVLVQIQISTLKLCYHFTIWACCNFWRNPSGFSSIFCLSLSFLFIFYFQHLQWILIVHPFARAPWSRPELSHLTI